MRSHSLIESTNSIGSADFKSEGGISSSQDFPDRMVLADPQRRERSSTQRNERQQEYDKPVSVLERTVLRDRLVRSCGPNCGIHQFEPERIQTIAGDEMRFASAGFRLASNALGGVQQPSQIDFRKNQSETQTQVVQFNGYRTLRAALAPMVHKCCDHLWIDRVLGRINVDVQALILQVPRKKHPQANCSEARVAAARWAPGPLSSRKSPFTKAVSQHRRMSGGHSRNGSCLRSPAISPLRSCWRWSTKAASCGPSARLDAVQIAASIRRW